jgi:hypothetical protein
MDVKSTSVARRAAGGDSAADAGVFGGDSLDFHLRDVPVDVGVLQQERLVSIRGGVSFLGLHCRSIAGYGLSNGRGQSSTSSMGLGGLRGDGLRGGLLPPVALKGAEEH